MAKRHSGMRSEKGLDHRLRRLRVHSMNAPIDEGRDSGKRPREQVVLDCGWGSLIFAQTFKTNEDIVAALRQERPDRRDIAFYVRDPHVLLSLAPQETFLDPSHTYRLDLSTYRAGRRSPKGYFIR
ncbi:MAG TPA: hypothetical protein VFP00_10990, partial [Burkholderiales bacterium]|nr:hypothetical protein [Burkholderiales bacterium]